MCSILDEVTGVCPWFAVVDQKVGRTDERITELKKRKEHRLCFINAVYTSYMRL
jgi:hypothetical protein